MIVKELREALVKRAIAYDLPSTQPVIKDPHTPYCCVGHRIKIGGPGCICLRSFPRLFKEDMENVTAFTLGDILKKRLYGK